MIDTYSVIIQNQKTIDVFSQYQVLFAEAISNNRIGVCKWIESGTTIETALPELGSLTDDKEEWCAIIVRYIDDNCMAACPSNPQNPYDFMIQGGTSSQIEDSSVPLVRLTQMLGGLPPLEVEFEAKIINEDHKAPRTIYEPIYDEEKERAYKELEKKYQYDGISPSIIYIVTIREKKYLDESIGKAWLTHKESMSSEFWKRNRYPSLCRFIICDYENNGPVQRDADDFNFWLSVLLLGINDMDSSTLQAYRLYRINSVIDKEDMIDSVQILANKLRDSKTIIERNIKSDIENQIGEEIELPKYKLDVPVNIKLPKVSERSVKKKSFHLLSRGGNTDIGTWENQKRQVEEELASSVRTAKRALDYSANRMRGNYAFSSNEITPLNRYQEEDLSRETEELYDEIVRIQGKLPRESISSDEKLIEVEKEIHKKLSGRVTKKPALIAFLITALAVVLFSVPAFIVANNVSSQLLFRVGMVAAAIIVVVFVFVCGLLAIQKIKLNSLINKYNRIMKDAFNKLVENAGDYSDYMSNIISHARACSYIDLSRKEKTAAMESHSGKYKHIKTINILIGQLRRWSKAYHLSTDFSSARSLDDSADMSISSLDNVIYSFETGKSYSIALNNSGMTMVSPFKFVKKLEIIREEIYDEN